MADEDSILTNPDTPEVARHVRDYSNFTQMLKWGTIVCLIIAFVIVVFIL